VKPAATFGRSIQRVDTAVVVTGLAMVATTLDEISSFMKEQTSSEKRTQ
jgi:hypothetical protein